MFKVDFDVFRIQLDPPTEEETLLNDGEVISSSTVSSDDPLMRQEITVETEVKTEYQDDPNPVLGWLNDLVKGREKKVFEREKKTVKTIYYDENGQELYSIEEVSYTDWEWVDTRRDNPKITIAPSPPIPIFDFPLERPNTMLLEGGDEQKEDPAQSSHISEVESAAAEGKRLYAVKDTGADINSYYSQVGESDEDIFYSNWKYQALGGIVDVTLSPGDVILAPGVTREMVELSGYKIPDDADVFQLSYQQLTFNRVPGSMGTVPRDYDFLIITKFQPTNRGVKENGAYTVSYGTVRTWFDVYKLEEEE